LRQRQSVNEAHQARFRRRLTNAISAKSRRLYGQRLAASVRNGEKLALAIERRLAELETKQLEQPKVVAAAPAPTVTPSQWPWRANITLRFGDVTYARGCVIPDELLAASFNADHLIRNGHVKRVPPQPAKQPKPVAPTVSVATPVALVDHIKMLYDAMAALAAKRKCAIGDVEDAVDLSDLKDRAMKQFVDEPQQAMSTAWGGNNTLTASGQGSSRRIFDVPAFRKRLYSYGQEKAA
jgi:hypothetical protein